MYNMNIYKVMLHKLVLINVKLNDQIVEMTDGKSKECDA